MDRDDRWDGGREREGGKEGRKEEQRLGRKEKGEGKEGEEGEGRGKETSGRDSKGGREKMGGREGKYRDKHTSLNLRSASPSYGEVRSAPVVATRHAPVSAHNCRISDVFPHPGGPTNSTPVGDWVC